MTQGELFTYLTYHHKSRIALRTEIRTDGMEATYLVAGMVSSLHRRVE